MNQPNPTPEPEAKEPGQVAWATFYGDGAPVSWAGLSSRSRGYWADVERAVLEAAGVERPCRQCAIERESAIARAEAAESQRDAAWVAHNKSRHRLEKALGELAESRRHNGIITTDARDRIAQLEKVVEAADRMRSCVYGYGVVDRTEIHTLAIGYDRARAALDAAKEDSGEPGPDQVADTAAVPEVADPGSSAPGCSSFNGPIEPLKAEIAELRAGNELTEARFAELWKRLEMLDEVTATHLDAVRKRLQSLEQAQRKGGETRHVGEPVE